MQLYRDLKLQGLNPWIDLKNIKPGEKWKLAIRQAIKDSNIFIALLSSNSVSKRGFVQKELKIAMDLLDEFPVNEVFIIPIRLNNCKPANPELQDLQRLDFFPSYEIGLKKLLNFILPSDNSNKSFLESMAESVFADEALSFEDKITKMHGLKYEEGIIVVADIRNFTKTVEDNSVMKIQSFTSEFFKNFSVLIRSTSEDNVFISFLLGGGIFARIQNKSNAGSIVDAARQILLTFNVLKKAFNFRYADLSIALSITGLQMSTIGDAHEINYTLLDPEVNKLFKMLSSTEGGLVYVSSNFNNIISSTHHLVYVADMKYKGIAPRIPVYSVIRKRSDFEIENNKNEKCNEIKCVNFHICQSAWEIGRSKIGLFEGEYFFDLYCDACGKDNNKCWLWNNCIRKYNSVAKASYATCCNMCNNFRNCFHNYQLGRQSYDMVSCDKQLNDSFILSKQ